MFVHHVGEPRCKATAPNDETGGIRIMRKVIFNDDGGGSRIPRYLIRSEEEFLEQRGSGLEGSSVDTVSFCTTAGTFGRFYHRSEVGETADDVQGRYFPSIIPDLVESGTDPLAVMTAYCHELGKEIWWSFRMNDTHDASNELLVPKMKKQHPEYLLGALGDSQKYGTWSSVDYGVDKIRKLAVRYTDEVLEKYEIDGVELDFFRHPVFFQSVAKGHEASEQDRALMTEVVCQIHDSVKNTERRRSVPVSLSIIIPDDISYCRAIGLDVEAWFRAGLIDAVTTTGYFRLNSWEYSADLGQRFDVPVYAGLQESRVRDESGKALRSSLPANRGRILQALSAGVSGVSMYNAFNTFDPIFRQAGDRDALAAAPRYYFPCVRGIGRPAGRPLPYESYMTIPTIDPDHPLRIASGDSETIPISVPAPPAADDRAEVRIRINCGDEPGTIDATMNDTGLTLTPWKGDWYYAACGRALNDGLNSVSLTCTGCRELKIEDIFIAAIGRS